MKKIFLFILITGFISFNCSRTSDEEYMKMAAEKVKNEKISEAVLDYQNLISEYPQSSLAPEAITKLAALYHANKVGKISKEESLVKAVKLFSSVSEKYPSSDQAPQSLFMAGFIYANEIQDYASAKKTYNTFLQKYPAHELASSAKEEIDNMGLSPEQILERKIAADKQ